jgi:hypothetical protein
MVSDTNVKSIVEYPNAYGLLIDDSKAVITYQSITNHWFHPTVFWKPTCNKEINIFLIYSYTNITQYHNLHDKSDTEMFPQWQWSMAVLAT